jgi:hypothetical protein
MYIVFHFMDEAVEINQSRALLESKSRRMNTLGLPTMCSPLWAQQWYKVASLLDLLILQISRDISMSSMSQLTLTQIWCRITAEILAPPVLALGIYLAQELNVN